ncbi:MAG: 3-keto-disaccharide hydrolase [Opitutaceae bacterium]
MDTLRLKLFAYCLFIPCLLLAQATDELKEPTVRGEGWVSLIKKDSLEGWKVASEHWSIEGSTIVGDTGSKPLAAPEWLYTETRFQDFVFTCELKLSGSRKPNSGIYFRVNPIQFQWRKNTPIYEAASGYEFDVVPGKFCGSLGDWYARPKLRVFADRDVIEGAYKENDWNRMTIRARANHIEYWLNGVKILDYVDNDPKGSREGILGLQIHDNAVMRIEMRTAEILPIESE